MKYYARVGTREYEIEIENDQITIDGELVEIDLCRSGVTQLYSLLFNHQSYELLINPERFNYTVTMRGEQFQVQVEDERARRLNARRKPAMSLDGELGVAAPIPGMVVKVLVQAGDVVEEEQALIILEAMKMENELRAPRAGIVREVKALPGQRVEQNALLILLGEK